MSTARCRVFLTQNLKSYPSTSFPASKRNVKRLMVKARYRPAGALIMIKCRKEKGVQYTPGAPTSMRLLTCNKRSSGRGPYTMRCSWSEFGREVYKALPKGR